MAAAIRRERLFVVGFVLAVALPWLVLASTGTGYHANYGAGSKLHWAYEGQDRPYVNWVDYTASSWPVSAVSGSWDTASAIDANYRAPGGCSNGHCVDVSAFNFNAGCLQSSGYAAWAWDSRGHLRGGPTHYRLNSKCVGSQTDNYRRRITCQEAGHTLGLGHRTEVGTCMHQNATYATQGVPDAHDFDVVQTSHTHASKVGDTTGPEVGSGGSGTP